MKNTLQEIAYGAWWGVKSAFWWSGSSDEDMRIGEGGRTNYVSDTEITVKFGIKWGVRGVCAGLIGFGVYAGLSYLLS